MVEQIILIYQIQSEMKSQFLAVGVISIMLLAGGHLLALDSTAASGYDVKQSERYAAYSFAAFCPQQCIENWSCKLTAPYNLLTNVTYIENPAAQTVCFVGYDPADHAIIVSWRGTANKPNWIEDFNFEMQPYSGCSGCFIHTGFMTDYILSQKRILSAINNIMNDYRVNKIVSTGHSLGGALTIITGLQLSQKYPHIKTVIHNFGSPRVGNQNLANFIVQKVAQIYRVVHSHDLIPHLPPSIEYKHTPYEVFFDDQMVNYKVCSSSGEDPNCSNQYFPFYTMDDHDFYFMKLHSKC